MEKIEKPFDIGLSIKQEVSKQKEFGEQIFWAESPAEAEVIIEDYKVFVENSTHNREPLMIASCLDSVEQRCTGSEIDSTFATEISGNLFPILYKKIAFREEISTEHFKKLGTSILKCLDNEYLDTTSKDRLERAFNILCLFLTNGEK